MHARRCGRWICALTAGLTVAGCVAESDGDAVERTGEATQAIAGSSWSWGTLDGTDLDIGPDHNQICFLRGVHGTVKGAIVLAEELTAIPGRAGVYRRNGRYVIETRPGIGTGVSAQVSCIPLTEASDRQHIVVAEATDPTTIVAGGSDRHCMLTSVSATVDAWSALRDDHRPPGVKLDRENVLGVMKWVFRAFLIPNPDKPPSSGGAEAVCFTYASNGTHDFGESGPSSGILFHDDGGWMCGLSGLFGVFTNSWNQPGAEVFRSAAGDWRYELNAQHALYAHCIR